MAALGLLAQLIVIALSFSLGLLVASNWDEWRK